MEGQQRMCPTGICWKSHARPAQWCAPAMAALRRRFPGAPDAGAVEMETFTPELSRIRFTLPAKVQNPPDKIDSPGEQHVRVEEE
jgi:hypothetical protein